MKRLLFALVLAGMSTGAFGDPLFNTHTHDFQHQWPHEAPHDHSHYHYPPGPSPYRYDPYGELEDQQ